MPYDRGKVEGRRGGVLGAGYPGGVEGSVFDRVSLRREKGRGVGDPDVGNLSSESFTMKETHAPLSHDTDISDADRIRSISDSARGAVSSSNLPELTRPDPKPPPDESLELTEFSERPSPKPPPVDESEPPSDESAESVELPSACLRPGSKPPPDESLNDESSSPILTTQRLSPIAKVSEPVAQRLSPTAKVFEPAEVPERSSSNVPSVGESSDRLSSELSKLRAATPIVDFTPTDIL